MMKRSGFPYEEPMICQLPAQQYGAGSYDLAYLNPYFTGISNSLVQLDAALYDFNSGFGSSAWQDEEEDDDYGAPTYWQLDDMLPYMGNLYGGIVEMDA